MFKHGIGLIRCPTDAQPDLCAATRARQRYFYQMTDRQIAEELMRTCYQLYAKTPTVRQQEGPHRTHPDSDFPFISSTCAFLLVKYVVAEDMRYTCMKAQRLGYSGFLYPKIMKIDGLERHLP